MLPRTEKRNYKTILMYYNSLWYNYDNIKAGKEYSYKELISLITDEGGGKLPEKSSGKWRIPQLEAFKITLDMEERGSTQNRKYYIKAKHEYAPEQKQEIIDKINQDYLLTRSNKKGLIYEIILCLLYLRGRTIEFGNKTYKAMEFSKSGWEIEIGLVSRVFQKMLYNDDNILTKTIMGNILKVCTDEAKKHVFSRALDFIIDDQDIYCNLKTKVIYINENEEPGKIHAHLPQVEYNGRKYNYDLGYAHPLLEDRIKKIEDQVLESMGFLNKSALVGEGKYNQFLKQVRERIREINPITMIKALDGETDVSFGHKLNPKITILGYWKSYEIGIDPQRLEQRVKEIINGGQEEESERASEFGKKMGDSYLDNYNIVAEYLGLLKIELNEYIKDKIAEKVKLDKIDPKSEAGQALIKEISWLNYFAKHSQYRIFNDEAWGRYLFGAAANNLEDDGLHAIYDNKGVVVGLLDDNFRCIDTSTGTLIKPKTDDFVAIRELDAFVKQVMGGEDGLKGIKDKYNDKIDKLVQDSVSLSEHGEISKIGPDFETMNKKIRELMEMQFIPQEEALRYAYAIVKDKKLLTRQLMLELLKEE